MLADIWEVQGRCKINQTLTNRGSFLFAVWREKHYDQVEKKLLWKMRKAPEMPHISWCNVSLGDAYYVCPANAVTLTDGLVCRRAIIRTGSGRNSSFIANVLGLCSYLEFHQRHYYGRLSLGRHRVLHQCPNLRRIFPADVTESDSLI